MGSLFINIVVVTETLLVFIFYLTNADLWTRLVGPGIIGPAVLLETFLLFGASALLLLGFAKIKTRMEIWPDKLAGFWFFGFYLSASAVLVGAVILAILQPDAFMGTVRKILILAALPSVINLEIFGSIWLSRMRGVRERAAWLLDSEHGNRLALGLIFLTGMGLSALNILSAYGPVHLNDEAQYWNFALRIARGTGFPPVDAFRQPIYPLMLAPAFWFAPSTSYLIAKLLNAFYLTSSIFPLFILLKRLVGRRIALAGVVLLLLHPLYWMFPRAILSENIYIPLFLWVLALAFGGIYSGKDERVKAAEAILTGVLCGVLFLTRFITLAIAPAILIIWWIKPFEGESGKWLFSRRKAAYFGLLAGAFVLVVGACLVLGMNAGIPLKTLLGFGITSRSNPLQRTMDRLLLWVVFYLAYTLLIAAPVLNILLVGLARFDLKRWRGDAYRWIIAAVLICGGLLAACIRHSWRVFYNYPDPTKLQERYIFYFGILFLISAAVILKEYPLKKLRPAGIIFWTVIPTGLVILSYQIIYRGLFFLGRPLGISINSRDGAVIEAIGAIFVYLAAATILVSNLLLSKNRTIALLAIFAGVSVIYTSTAAPNYKNFMETESDNFAARMVSLRLVSDYPAAQVSGARLTVFYEPEINSASSITKIQSTLNFYGFDEVEMAADGQINDKMKDRYLVIEKDGVKIYDLYRFERFSPRYNDRTKQNTADGAYFFALDKYSQ